MATRSRNPSSLLLAVLLVGIFALQAAQAALTVANNLKGPLMVSQLPGCCSGCGEDPKSGASCPQVCVRCPDVVVAAGKEVTLDKHVGPYPLPLVRFEFGGRLWCVTSDHAKGITVSATLAVGPGVCRQTGLQAYVFLAGKPSQVEILCVPPCYV